MNGLLLFNSEAGDGNAKRLNELQAELQPADVWEFGSGEDMAELPARAAATPGRYVAVAGGDGTVESVAAALVGSDLTLGVIPCGTYNNFAKNLDLPHEIPEACRIIREGHTCLIDAGRVNGKIFFESVGMGLDAELFPAGERIKAGEVAQWQEVFAKAHRFRRTQFRLSFPAAIRDLVEKNDLVRGRSLRHLMRSDAKQVTLKSLLIIVSNTTLYGANFAIAPGQQPDDGKLTITVFLRHNKFRLWLHYLTIAFRKNTPTTDVLVLRSASLKVEADGFVPVHLDGDTIETSPDQKALKIECVHKVLRVFAPASKRTEDL